jgi:MoaA/NifB/PqqE/SkfB family radical SAM enzyme
MFKFDRLRNIHIEITNRCQASCPMCPRNIHGGIDNPLIKNADWSLEDFKTIFDQEVLGQLEKITFCGTFGDPMMNNDLIGMCQYIKDNSPAMDVRIHTNGSARNVEWWKSLVDALPTKHEIIFALDGLEDTQHLYRVGTSFNKIIENAKAVIASGGNAVWMFIRFKHNEHQVEQAKGLANELGFGDFILKNTRRFDGKSFVVLDRNGKPTHMLEQPSDNIVKFVNKKDLETYRDWKNSGDINCFASNDREIYIDANFTLMPCCIMSAFLYTNYDQSILEKYHLYDPETAVNDVGGMIQTQVFEIINELGGLENLNAKGYGIKNIINRDQWQTMWAEKWKENSSACCTILCSADSPYITLDEQQVE